MSFGASGSLRFDVGSQDEKPVIFWESESQKKSNKKFSYKKKEMKYPLRKAQTASTQDPVPNNNKINQKHEKSEQNFIKKNKGKATEKLIRTKDGIKKENGGFYTLTHEQLNSILKSVGKIASVRGDGVNIAIEQAIALQQHGKDPLTNELQIDGGEEKVNEQNNDSNQGETNRESVQGDNSVQPSPRPNGEITNRQDKLSSAKLTDRKETKKRREKRTKHEEDSNKGHEPSHPLPEDNPVPKFSPPPIPRAHMTKAEKLRLEMKQESDGEVYQKDSSQPADASGVKRPRNPLTNSVADDPPPIKYHIPPILPKAHLTMAEKKRLQWEIERGETINTPPSKKADHVQITAQKTSALDHWKEGPADSKGDNHVDSEEIMSPRSMPVPKPHLSQAERKRAQWDAERAEQQKEKDYDPWGRPGAGAPIRSNSGHVLTDYNSRKEQVLRTSLDKSFGHTAAPSVPPPQTVHAAIPVNSPRMIPTQDPSTVPAAMRTSFAIGYVAPNEERFKSTKEEERRKWLEDLEKQKEEKRLQKMKEKEKDREYFAETWADKLTYDTHDVKHVPGYSVTATLSPRAVNEPEPAPSPRVASAPQSGTQDHSQTYIRGQGGFLDPATQKEIDEKRKRHLEHQAAVIAQVEEKQRLKRLERERKIQEEQEEERKLQEQRDVLQRQYDMEQQKSRLKEAAREQRLQELKDAMDQAQLTAQQDKYSRRMQHLQMGGHDIKNLQANIEDSSPVPDSSFPTAVPVMSLHSDSAHLTPRPTVRHVAPVSVPGLDISPRPWQAPEEILHQTVPPPTQAPRATSPRTTQRTTEKYHHEPYTENRVITPSIYRKPVDNPLSPHREFGTQTDMGLLSEDFLRQTSEDSITFKENKRPSNKKVKVMEANRDSKQSKPPIGRKKGPVKITERPKWGTQNPSKKKPTKQSEKDPFFERKKREREERKWKRERELLALVEANKRIIPQKVNGASRHRDQSPDGGQNHCDQSPEVTEREVYHQPNERLRPLERFEMERSRARQRSKSPGRHRQDEQSAERSRSQGQGPSHEEDFTITHTVHVSSPPVPALRHKLDSWREPKQFDNDYDIDAHSYKSSNQKPKPERRPVESHYEDDTLGEGRFELNDFVPFMRTSEVLDPVKATVPVIVSRENSAVTKARQEYHKGLRPGALGNQLENFDDRKYNIISPAYKDPILNPNVVKGYPTPRQDLILQQLSDLKMNLMQRRREVETAMSPKELGSREHLY